MWSKRIKCALYGLAFRGCLAGTVEEPEEPLLDARKLSSNLKLKPQQKAALNAVHSARMFGKIKILDFKENSETDQLSKKFGEQKEESAESERTR